ncbi:MULTISPECIES: hypothetical protein [Gammaproteobacteria]|uniref:hypothetical protein n=1 Tax=Gammaproteobacteria TaxID=1236 RepID=UPI000D529A72|nr:hypothetical protein [Proteus mirabilis]ELA7948803.1 hypothetical protein [Proteus mirabilis]MBG3047924.1 hypothetical protein [Proteus mirabilis]MBG6021301.1 hypothetical protein [Proteus mirabilis]MBI6269325.1 hypothetical protein [Proteus mirabilis]MBI6302605.1 hypothetical protein [Proteus mirabilis]
MLKTFHLTGYTTSKCGLSVGFSLNIKAADAKHAHTVLLNGFAEMGCSLTRITKINGADRGASHA